MCRCAELFAYVSGERSLSAFSILSPFTSFKDNSLSPKVVFMHQFLSLLLYESTQSCMSAPILSQVLSSQRCLASPGSEGESPWAWLGQDPGSPRVIVSPSATHTGHNCTNNNQPLTAAHRIEVYKWKNSLIK